MLVFTNKTDKIVKYIGFILLCSFELKLLYQISLANECPSLSRDLYLEFLFMAVSNVFISDCSRLKK